ncbi:type II toxin-antitoxin system RelE/ParE family toxin [Streptomyces sp. NPDC049879]
MRRVEYRLRVGDYRIVYQVDDRVVRITVIDVDHRRDAYR